MRLLKIALPIAVLVAAIFVLYAKFFQGSEKDATPVESEASAAVQNKTVRNELNAETAGGSPAPTIDSDDNNPSVSLVSPSIGAPKPKSEINSTASTPTPRPDYPALAGYEVGVGNISEEERMELIDRLRNDPVLLAEVLDELRAETDPSRLKQLTILLGATGSPDVLPVAEELVYSSSSIARKTGLDLLSRVAPQNPAAYDIANSILSSEADPDVLVSTMNVLALPKNAGPDARATAISQIIPLANHESAAVRRHSVSILVRLTNNETLSPVLFNALSDPDTSVREAAAFAYARYPFQTSEAVERLLDIVEDPSEDRSVRQGALLALSNMSPDEEMRERIEAAKKQMR